MAVGMALFFAVSADATSLKAISGDDQIKQAKTIFRGRVDHIDAARDWSKSHGPVISTIQFTPLAVYKGTVPGPISLKFLGGKTTDIEMKVLGMPTFEVGGEYVLFVSGTDNRACPVVGWTEGTLKVDRLTVPGGSVPISETTSGWLKKTSMARSRAVMPSKLDLAQFESLLRERVAQVGAAK